MNNTKKRGAPLGNQYAKGNPGNPNPRRGPRTDTKTFNLTLPSSLYQQLERYRLEGYGSKSEIIASLMGSRLEGYMAEARELADKLDALEPRQ